MTPLVAALASLLTVLLPGLALTDLVPELRRRGAAERFAYAFLLGTAWTGAALFAANHLAGLPLAGVAFVAVPALPVALALVRRWRARGGDPAGETGRETGELTGLPAAGRERWVVLAAVALAAFLSAGLFLHSGTRPLSDWDGRMIWASQGRHFAGAESVSPLALTRARWYVSHPQYPPLLPLVQAQSLGLFADDSDDFPFRGVYAAFYPAWLALLFAAGRRAGGSLTAAATVAAAACLPFPLLAIEGGAAGGYSDFPLACFFGAALLLAADRRGGTAAGLAAGLLAAALVLTKNEGLPLALALLPAAVVAAGPAAWGRDERRRSALRLAATAAPAVAAFALLAHWRSAIPNRFDEMYLEKFSLGAVLRGLTGRLPRALPTIGDDTFALADWGLAWVVVPLVVALALPRLLARRDERWTAAGLALAAAAPLAVAVLAYSVHPAPGKLADVTWNRFLVQASVPLLALFAHSWARLRE